MRSDSKHPTNVKDKLETYSDVESVHLQVSMHKHTCGSVREKNLQRERNKKKNVLCEPASELRDL